MDVYFGPGGFVGLMVVIMIVCWLISAPRTIVRCADLSNSSKYSIYPGSSIRNISKYSLSFCLCQWICSISSIKIQIPRNESYRLIYCMCEGHGPLVWCWTRVRHSWKRHPLRLWEGIQLARGTWLGRSCLPHRFGISNPDVCFRSRIVFVSASIHFSGAQ